MKAAREKQQVTYKLTYIKLTYIKLTADLSTETLQAGKEWQDILKVMKRKSNNQDYSIQQGPHSDLKEKSKALQTKVRRIHTNKGALQQMLKDFL